METNSDGKVKSPVGNRLRTRSLLPIPRSIGSRIPEPVTKLNYPPSALDKKPLVPLLHPPLSCGSADSVSPEGSDVDLNSNVWATHIGARVCISNAKCGILRFYGTTSFSNGCWCGIELDEPVGKNSGVVNGVEYFICRENHGIFAPPSKVKFLDPTSPSTSKKVCDLTVDLGTAREGGRSSVLNQTVCVSEPETHGSSVMNSTICIDTDGNRSSGLHRPNCIDLENRRPSSILNRTVCLEPETSKVPSKLMQPKIFPKSISTKIPPGVSLACNASYVIESDCRSESPNSLASDSFKSDVNKVSSTKSSPERRPLVTGTIVRPRVLSPSKKQMFETLNRTFTAESPLPAKETPVEEAGLPVFDKNCDVNGEPDSPEVLEDLEYDNFQTTFCVLPHGIVEAENSLDFDESLGILTPNQMKDFTMFAECNLLKTPSIEDIFELPHEVESEFVLDHLEEAIEEEALVNLMGLIPEITSTPHDPKDLPPFKWFRTPLITDENLPPVDENASSGYIPYLLENTAEISGITPTSDKPNRFDTSGSLVDVKPKMIENWTPDLNSSGKGLTDESVSQEVLDLIRNRSSELMKHLNDADFSVEKVTGIAEVMSKGLIQDSLRELSVASCIIPHFPKLLVDQVNPYSGGQLIDDQAPTDILMQRMGHNFCDAVEKKDRPVSSLTMSVTSIDTGYQGDAECDVQSGTTSAVNTPVDEQKRVIGAAEEKESIGGDPCVLRHPRVDIGSDSDFCSDMGTSWTESEVECDDKSKGRSARVIDGTLYYNNNDDCEKKTIRVEDGHLDNDPVVKNESVEQLLTAQKVMDVQGKDSDSSTLEDSQSQTFSEPFDTIEKPSVLQVEICDKPCSSDPCLLDPAASDSLHELAEKSFPAVDVVVVVADDVMVNIESALEGNTSQQKTPQTGGNNNKKVRRKKDEVELMTKRYKSPKKNVMSKIKAMIEATTCKNNVGGNNKEGGVDENIMVGNDQSPRNSSRTPKKSRWEAVMSKIAAGKAEEKAKGKTKRDVKSKVNTNLTGVSNKSSPKDDLSRRNLERSVGGPRLLKRDSTFSSTGENVSESDPVHNDSNRSSRSDLTSDKANTSKSKGPRMSPTAADGPKSERAPSPSQLSDISTMSAASHLSSFSQASSLRTLQKPYTSLSPRHRRDPIPSSESSKPSLTPNVLKNNRKNAASTAANKVPPLNLGAGKQVPKKAQPPSLPNGTPRYAVASKAATPRDTKPNAVRQLQRSLNARPPLPQQRANVPKTLSAAVDKVQLTKEQNRGRSLKPSSGIIKSGHHQPDLLNLSPGVANQAETDKEVTRLEQLCDSQVKENCRLRSLLDDRTMGFEAVAIVVKYLVDDMKALAHPSMVKELDTLHMMLDSCKNDLDQTILEKESLQTKTADLINDLTKLKEDHANEIAAVQESLRQKFESELEKLKIELIEKEEKLKHSHEEEINELKTKHDDTDRELADHCEKQISELRLQYETSLKNTEEQHTEKVNTLTKDYTAVQNGLQEQLQTLNSQCSQLQRQKREFEEVILKDSDLKFQVAAGKIAGLEKEVDSLKTVLELRNNELHELRAASNKVNRLEEELHFADEKVKLLRAKTEDLQAQVDRKNSTERQLSNEHKLLKEWYEKESNVNKRLSMENEQLQWKLHQSMEGPALTALWGNPQNLSLEYNCESPSNFCPVNSTPIIAGASDGESLEYKHFMCKRGLTVAHSRVVTEKPRVPTSAREVRTRHRRQRFSISEEDAVPVERDLSPGSRYRRAQSLSWTVGLKCQDGVSNPTAVTPSRANDEVACKRNLATDILSNGKDSVEDVMDESVEKEFEAAVPLSDGKSCETESVDPERSVVGEERVSEKTDCSFESPTITPTKPVPLERRKGSTPDARVPSLITVQYLDEQGSRPHSSISSRGHGRRERGGSLGSLKDHHDSSSVVNRLCRSAGSARGKTSPKRSPKRESVNGLATVDNVITERRQIISDDTNEELMTIESSEADLPVATTDVMDSSLDAIEIDYAMRCSTLSSETGLDMTITHRGKEEVECDVMFSSSDFEDPTQADADAEEREEEVEAEMESEDLCVPLTGCFKMEGKPAGSSCGSSPPPESVELLQMSENSQSSRSEDSSPRTSPAFRPRPGDESLSQSAASCNYAMSPRTSAGESMVIVDLAAAQRRDHVVVSDVTSLLIRRTFPELYLQETGGGTTGNGGFSVTSATTLESANKEEEENGGQSYISKPDTPESSSLAVAPTDSTNIDLSWSEEEEDIPSESEV